MGPPAPSSTLLQSLQNPALYDHPVHEFQLIETHISWVLLTGAFAYKIKKPVDLGFVNFTTLERRHHFCTEELRLNRRLAPDLYLDVVAIAGSPEHPQFDGTQPPIEYAVKMKQFPQECLLSRALEEGKLSVEHVDALGKQIADFHRRIDVAGVDAPCGDPDVLIQPVRDNFEQLPPEAPHVLGLSRIAALRNWSEQEHAARREHFMQRKADGFIRECHGDLHLGNMALIDGRIVIFDCIEFSSSLRWIDVMSELAFVIMDLIDRKHPHLAYRLMNAYLEHTGDYEGLSVFRFYQVYRAMVRAKVAGIRLKQEETGDPQREHTQEELRSYVALAERLTRPSPPSLIIMHGLSGSGKTMVSQIILEAMGAVRIRSDVERKRLFGLLPEARTGDEASATLYSKDATRVTYSRLEELAEKIVKAGFTVIVDATFLNQMQRQTFKHVAERHHVPFLILDVFASDATVRKRVRHREEQGADASEATVSVLEQQLLHQEPFSSSEQSHVLHIKNDERLNRERLKEELMKRGFRFQAPGFMNEVSSPFEHET